MKYFIAEHDGQELQFSRVTNLRRWLKDHPEVASVHRYWWYRNDLVECEEIKRETILGKTARQLTQGETAQWAANHGRLR